MELTVSKGQRIILPRAAKATDPQSGRRIRQVTNHPSIHHHPFFFVPAYDRAMKRLIFVSYRTGKPQIFFEDRASGELVQATDRPDLADWSIIPSGDGRYVYFTAGTAGWRVNLDTFEEEQLADFGAVEMREKGMVGAAMGTTALSTSGRWWAVPVKAGPVTRFVLIDTEKKTSSVFLERDTIGHPQFCPDDEDLILYAGPLTDRVWVTDRSGAKNRRLYSARRQDAVGHPRGLGAGPPHRRLRRLAARHADDRRRSRRGAPDHLFAGLARGAGRRRASNSSATPTFPDRGLHTFDVDDDPADEAAPLCASEASSEGKHWGGPFPYNDGPVAVEAAQHTHPHPRFSPDDSRVVFTSDKTGHAQLYEVMLDDRPMTAGLLESQRVRAGDPRRPHHRHEPRPRARLRAVQSRDPAEGIRVRLPALLPAQPARLPGAGSHRSRQPDAEEARADRATCAPTARATRSIATASAPRTAPISPICGATISSPS